MPGRTESKIYSGPDGAVYRTEGLSGVQYHARTVKHGRPAGRYYTTAAGARRWLAKIHPGRGENKES